VANGRRDSRQSAASRGYGSRWRRFRASFLASHPLCVMCLASGRTTQASVVDHIVPHRGDMALFWQPGNHQALCKEHHDSAKKAEEHHGHAIGCDVNGTPNDPRHHWHTKPRC
jgi:5-methylcytosine-specific restriction endonuclease McrA